MTRSPKIVLVVFFVSVNLIFFGLGFGWGNLTIKTKANAYILGDGGESIEWIDRLKSHFTPTPGALIFYTWTNYAMHDFLLNWIEWMHSHSLRNLVIGSMDNETTEYLKQIEFKMPVYVVNLHSGLTTGEFGWNSPAFKKMAKSKFQSVQQMQEAGFDVFVSDTDVVFMNNPEPVLRTIEQPDILVSTDTLRRMPIDQQMHTMLNIGMMLFRARPAAIDFVKTFYNAMVNDPNFGTDKALWDQSRFNDMAKSQSSVKISALDVLDFCNGHVYYTQQLPQKLGHRSIAVHNTFQFSNVPGKRHRFREARLWIADPMNYFKQKYVSFDMHLPPNLLDASKLSVQGHFNLMNYQLAQIRTALAISLITERTLVMPALWCGLDRAWFASFPGGRFPGSDELFTLPFLCPLDHVLDLEGMARIGLLDKIREYSFFNDSRAPKQKFHVTWGEAHFRNGIVASDIRRVHTDYYGNYQVLHFDSMLPVHFGGFDQGREQTEFDDKMKQIISIWCCDHHNPGHVHYDFLFDKPHTDKFGRVYNNTWDVRHGP